MRTQLSLSTGGAVRLTSDESRRLILRPWVADDSRQEREAGGLLAEARPVLRAAATLAAIALAGFAIVVIALLGLLGAL